MCSHVVNVLLGYPDLLPSMVLLGYPDLLPSMSSNLVQRQ